LLDCGIDDLGGVSPVTDDHINPEYEWPALRELERIAETAGVPLSERLPVYDRYVSSEWLSPRIEAAIDADGEAGKRYRALLD
jgi:FO synthase subunit 1